MKRFLLVAMVAFVGMTLWSSISVGADITLKIGYVDIDRVFDAYNKVKGISEMVEAGRTERARREKEIKKEGKELREKESTLGKEEKQKIEKDIQIKLQQLVEFDRAQRKKERESVQKGLSRICRIVEKVGEREGFDLILQKRDGVFGNSILFGKKSLDLTDKVIKDLPKKQ